MYQANIQHILFLCTGNYFRSRFAEELFNFKAQQTRLTCLAASRGLALEKGTLNIGPISSYALEGLLARGITLPVLRFPKPLQESDLIKANLIIALNELEHQPLLKARFPRWLASVEFWHICDIDEIAPEKALAQIEAKVVSLQQLLSAKIT